ncbi:MAG: EcsC family protein [Culicoidibacterales bacterium]
MTNQINEEVELLTFESDSGMLSGVEEMDLEGSPLMQVLDNAIKIPGVKINRTAFLMQTYNLSATDAENKNIAEIITLEQMDKAAKKFITTNVTQSSAAAFALGLPGGFAMAATIPADIMQNFAFSLRLAQQLAYIYGFDNLFTENNEVDNETRYTFIAFLGIMFAVSGSGSVLRAMAPNVGKYIAKQTMKATLTKTTWYPMLKKISGIVSSKTLTKKGLSSFASKAIPVVGGVASASINVATMIPMANRLKNELRKYYLSEEEILAIEKKEQASFGDKASDVISDVASGSIKTVGKAKDIGGKLSGFAKKTYSKTKEKIEQE